MLQYDGVQTDWVLFIHKTMNDLQHWTVEGCGVIKAKDVAFGTSSNAMYIVKRGVPLETMIQLRAAHTYNSHVISKWYGCDVLG